MPRQEHASRGDRLAVWVQVPLRRGQRAVAGDLLQLVREYASVGEPSERRVPEIVPAQVLVAEFGDGLIPSCGVAQDRRRDSAAARPGEEAGVFRAVGRGGPADRWPVAPDRAQPGPARRCGRRARPRRGGRCGRWPRRRERDVALSLQPPPRHATHGPPQRRLVLDGPLDLTHRQCGDDARVSAQGAVARAAG